MKARVKEDSGIYGLTIPCFYKDEVIDVRPFTESDGKPSEKFFQVTEGRFKGTVFDKEGLEFIG